MSQGTKIVLAVVVAGLFCCCVAGLGGALLGTRLITQAIITDPARVAEVGGQIANYQVPAGYQQAFALDILGVKMIAMTSGTDRTAFTVLALMQFPAPAAVSRAEIERQMQQALAQQTGMGSPDLHVTGQQQVTIKGEPVTLTVREGTGSDGVAVRQVTGLFQGKGGPCLLMVMGEGNEWDQPAVDQFIASIR
jgi:hypothetical protein